jgi:hypothetical protein
LGVRLRIRECVPRKNSFLTRTRFVNGGPVALLRHGIVVLAITALVALGCSSTEPDLDSTLNYEATTWLITGAISADAKAEGATLSLVLTNGGRVTGSLFMPASVAGGAAVNANMAGSWAKRGDTIRFSQISQTFVSDFAWLLTPLDLSAADSVDGSFYDVVLSRIFN